MHEPMLSLFWGSSSTTGLSKATVFKVLLMRPFVSTLFTTDAYPDWILALVLAFRQMPAIIIFASYAYMTTSTNVLIISVARIHVPLQRVVIAESFGAYGTLHSWWWRGAPDKS